MRAAWLSPLGHQANQGLDPDDCDDSDDWISSATPTLPPMAMRRVSTTGRLDPWFQVRRSVQRAREPSPPADTSSARIVQKCQDTTVVATVWAAATPSG